MKKIFKSFGVLLSVALAGAFSACNIQEETGSADIGLGVKVFFPTKVVAGQPMTINGSGFQDVKEIVFPDGIAVTNFKLVSDGMIRVNAPAGISSNGGKLIVRSATDEAESRQSLILGNPMVTGFSKQAGESVELGEQFTIYGQDLEFINSVELLDPDGNPLVITEDRFYRKGTDMVVFNIPKEAFEGTYSGKLFSIDGKEFSMPELEYTQPSGGGHWELQEKTLSEEVVVFDGWSATLVIPAALFADAQEGGIIRVYTSDKGDDYNPIFKHVDSWADWTEFQDIIVREDAYFESTITAAVLEELQSAGLRFQGVGFTITKVTLIQDVWVDPGHWETVEKVLSEEVTVFDGWSATLVVPAAMFADAQEDGIIRVYYTDKGDDFNPIFKHVDSWGDWNELQDFMEHGDGYFESTIPASALAELQSAGLRFQGLGFTITKVTLIQEMFIGGGGDTPSEVTLWDQETVFDSWSATIAIPGALFADAQEGYIVRVYYTGRGDDFNPIFKHVDSWGDWTEFQSAITHEDGYFEAPIPEGALSELQSAGLRFQGLGFTITKVMLIP